MIVVGSGIERQTFEAGAWGTFAEYGVDRPVSFPGGQRQDALVTMPLSLMVGAWLLERAEWAGPTRGEEVPGDASLAECHRIGADLASAADRVGLLVMGDGATGRTEDGPRPYDPRAEAFDRDVVAAFGAADPGALSGLDVTLAAELEVAGRAPWHILASAAGEALFDANVLYDGAPFGVGYVVAVWERHG
jgi:hypothetical protein